MANGELLELLVDDPRAPLDIPRAAEAEGHAVLSVKVGGLETPSPGSAGETNTILLEK
jgi:TusA-related sulfurtransferase